MEATRQLVLLRHAKAGDRSHWDGPDDRRPLTPAGRRQAEVLASRLGPLSIRRVLSSPYLRCLQTVQPFAQRVGLAVEPADQLREGTDLEEVLALMARLDGDALLCSHGDIIWALLEHLAALHVLRRPYAPTAKGAYWLIKQVDGRFTAAQHVDAP